MLCLRSEQVHGVCITLRLQRFLLFLGAQNTITPSPHILNARFFLVYLISIHTNYSNASVLFKAMGQKSGL